MKMRKWMLAGFVFAVCLVGHTQKAQENPDDVAFSMVSRGGSAEYLANACKSVEHSDPVKHLIPAKEAGNFGFCTGYIGAIIDVDKLNAGSNKIAVARYCVPENVSLSQLAKVVVKYGNDHPEELHFAAVGFVGMALDKAFPCG